MNSPKVKRVLKRQDLSSYLIAPVQRLPRYVLLLKELLKCTPEDHEDYNDIKQALDGITSIAATVDASKHQHESKEKMLEYAARFIPAVASSIIAPHRAFVAESVFYRTNSIIEMEAEDITIKDIHFFILFSDILVHARPNESYDLKKEKEPSSGGRMKTSRTKSAFEKQNIPQDLDLKKIFKVSAIDITPAHSMCRLQQDLYSFINIFLFRMQTWVKNY